jgi:hypothetical protein
MSMQATPVMSCKCAGRGSPCQCAGPCCPAPVASPLGTDPGGRAKAAAIDGGRALRHCGAELLLRCLPGPPVPKGASGRRPDAYTSWCCNRGCMSWRGTRPATRDWTVFDNLLRLCVVRSLLRKGFCCAHPALSPGIQVPGNPQLTQIDQRVIQHPLSGWPTRLPDRNSLTLFVSYPTVGGE